MRLANDVASWSSTIIGAITAIGLVAIGCWLLLPPLELKNYWAWTFEYGWYFGTIAVVAVIIGGVVRRRVFNGISEVVRCRGCGQWIYHRLPGCLHCGTPR